MLFGALKPHYLGPWTLRVGGVVIDIRVEDGTNCCHLDRQVGVEVEAPNYLTLSPTPSPMPYILSPKPFNSEP